MTRLEENKMIINEMERLNRPHLQWSDRREKWTIFCIAYIFENSGMRFEISYSIADTI